MVVDRNAFPEFSGEDQHKNSISSKASNPLPRAGLF
jgi:hypothetical protein